MRQDHRKGPLPAGRLNDSNLLICRRRFTALRRAILRKARSGHQGHRRTAALLARAQMSRSARRRVVAYATLWATDGQAYVEVERVVSHWRDLARAYRIFIDGTEVGKVSYGSTCKLAVSPGPHRLRMKIDWCSSDEISFDAQPGEIASFRCGPNAGSWRILYDATIGWARYISLALR